MHVGLGSMAYVPALKAREAEIKALQKAPNALLVTPLFELQVASAAGLDPVTNQPRRAKSAVTDASYFLDDIARLWDDPVYVDTSRVDGGRREQWWRLLDSLNSLATPPVGLIPVLLTSDSAASHLAAAGVASQTHRAALRISMPSVLRRPASLAGSTQAIATNMGIPINAIDVIFDWEDATDIVDLDDLVKLTTDAIAALGGQHGHLITIGTPNSDDFQQAGDWEADRREWWLWLRLAHAGVDVTYGDYALYPPADPVPAAPRYGHLRYSSGDQMHVHRRGIPAGGGGLGAAFRACCEHVLHQPHWLGRTFSSADRRIDDIASLTDKESVAGKWRQLAVEHHLALVAKQLANPPAPPPAGTP